MAENKSVRQKTWPASEQDEEAVVDMAGGDRAHRCSWKTVYGSRLHETRAPGERGDDGELTYGILDESRGGTETTCGLAGRRRTAALGFWLGATALQGGGYSRTR